MTTNCIPTEVRDLRWIVYLIALTGILSVVTATVPVRADAEACPNEALRAELRSGRLPDCRAYELVSPAYKQGYLVNFGALAPDGNSVIFSTLGTVANSENSVTFQGATYRAIRSSTGWVTEPLAPPASKFPALSNTDSSSDLSRTLWILHTSAQSIYAHDLYVREPNSVFRLIGPELPTERIPGPVGPLASGGSLTFYKGASADLSHIVFTINASESIEGNYFLWPGDTTRLNPGYTDGGPVTGGQSLYEYYNASGENEPKLVAVDNRGRLSSNNEAHLISQCGSELGSNGDTFNAVSPDGSTVFFTAQRGGCTSAIDGSTGYGPTVNELYARIGGAHTVAISKPVLPFDERCTGTCATAPASEGVFQGASEDGSKVFFTTTQPLLDSDGDEGNDLYEADIQGGRVARIVQVSRGDSSDPSAGSGAGVLGVSRVSEDGTHIYLVASGELTGTANPWGQKATPGSDNLYVYDTRDEHTSFVATLSPEDEEDVWNAMDRRPAQTTPDGGYFVFMSRAHLTPDDTSGANVRQIFEYDSQNPALVRVSRGQRSPVALGGYNDDGNTDDPGRAPLLQIMRYDGTDHASMAGLSLSSDGAYVAFISTDGLTPEAVDGSIGSCPMVYEYHSPAGDIGAGGVSLISTGDDPRSCEVPNDYNYYAIDPSGRDVIVGSSAGLTQQDGDTQLDLYDARAGGGFSAPVGSSACEGEGCQGPLSVPPSLSAVGGTAPAEGNLPLPTPAASGVPPTKAQKLAKALRICRAQRNRHKRVACEGQARRRYGLSRRKAPVTRRPGRSGRKVGG